MSLLRKSALNQLKKINKSIKKQGYNPDKTSKIEKSSSNILYIGDPIDDCINKGRKISTYENFLKEKTNNEKGNNDELSPSDINKNLKTIKNWYEYSKEINRITKERDILIAGNYIELDDVRGNIVKIQGNKVFIESFDDPMKIVTKNIKDIFINKKDDKDIKIYDLSLQNPVKK
jgi:hypothetical protein